MNLKKKKLFLLDMDGTLYLGTSLFEGTIPFLNKIKSQGAKYLFVTNNSSKGVNAYIEKLKKLGIESSKDDFLTSVDATIEYMRGRHDKDLIYALGTETFKEQLRDAGYNITDKLTDNFDKIKVLLTGYDTELTYQKLIDACKLLCLDKECKLIYIATNPDWVCPTEYGAVPDCGSMSEAIFNATGRRPKFIGKPEPDMALLSMKKFGVSEDETVLVGDRIYTDIACGLHAGIDTAFVLSGEGTMEDIEKYNVRPTKVYKDVGTMAAEM